MKNLNRFCWDAAVYAAALVMAVQQPLEVVSEAPTASPFSAAADGGCTPMLAHPPLTVEEGNDVVIMIVLSEPLLVHCPQGSPGAAVSREALSACAATSPPLCLLQPPVSPGPAAECTNPLKLEVTGSSEVAIKATFSYNATVNAALVVRHGGFSYGTSGVLLPASHLLTVGITPVGNMMDAVCTATFRPLCTTPPLPQSTPSTSSTDGAEPIALPGTFNSTTNGVRLTGEEVHLDLHVLIDGTAPGVPGADEITATVSLHQHEIMWTSAAGEELYLLAPIQLMVELGHAPVLDFQLQPTTLVVHDAVELEDVSPTYAEWAVGDVPPTFHPTARPRVR
jgi:hypothetical protein